MNIDVPFHKYTPFWNKYRPAILKMMQAELNDVQQYQFMKHELDDLGKRPKGGFDFQMVISASKVVNNISNSDIAKDLLNVLQLSQTGSALLATHRYEIALDKKLTLRISRQSINQNTSVQAEQ
jgi:hypothetical protein